MPSYISNYKKTTSFLAADHTRYDLKGDDSTWKDKLKTLFPVKSFYLSGCTTNCVTSCISPNLTTSITQFVVKRERDSSRL